MKRVRRWMLNGLTALLLVLIVVLGATWALGQRFSTCCFMQEQHSGFIAGILCNGQRISVTLCVGLPKRATPSPSWSVGCVTHCLPENSEVHRQRFGIGWQVAAFPIPDRAGPWTIAIPYAYLMLLAAIVPALRLWKSVRKTRIRCTGRCVHCGYDLRATPARCPECGEVPAAPPLQRHRLRTSWDWLRERPLAGLTMIVASAGVVFAAGHGIQAAGDALAFRSRAEFGGPYRIVFCKPPDERSLRYMARLKGNWALSFFAPDGSDANLWSPRPLRGIRFQNLVRIELPAEFPADVWLKEFARPDSGLASVTALALSGNNGIDAGMTELARPDSGMRALTQLDLTHSNVTDAGVKELVRSDTGVKGLKALFLGRGIGDQSLQALANSDSGLKGLTSLELWTTNVTSSGLRALAGPNSSLGTLTDLSLGQCTGEGLIALARPDGGLKSLATLWLAVTGVNDAGVLELCRPDAGLPALAELVLLNTRVTYIGVAALRKARPDLKLILSPESDPPPAPLLAPGVAPGEPAQTRPAAGR